MGGARSNSCAVLFASRGKGNVYLVKFSNLVQYLKTVFKFCIEISKGKSDQDLKEISATGVCCFFVYFPCVRLIVSLSRGMRGQWSYD